MAVLGWFALCAAIFGAWVLLFAVIANPVLAFPLFALGCVYFGYVHEPLRRRLGI